MQNVTPRTPPQLKRALAPLPSGADRTQWITHDDWNALSGYVDNIVSAINSAGATFDSPSNTFHSHCDDSRAFLCSTQLMPDGSIGPELAHIQIDQDGVWGVSNHGNGTLWVRDDGAYLLGSPDPTVPFAGSAVQAAPDAVWLYGGANGVHIKNNVGSNLALTIHRSDWGYNQVYAADDVFQIFGAANASPSLGVYDWGMGLGSQDGASWFTVGNDGFQFRSGMCSVNAAFARGYQVYDAGNGATQGIDLASTNLVAPNTSGGALTLTLGAGAAGQEIHVMDFWNSFAAHPLTIVPADGVRIWAPGTATAQASIVLGEVNAAVTLRCNGYSQWWIVSRV